MNPRVFLLVALGLLIPLASVRAQPIPVRLDKAATGWRLLRGGKDLRVQGAGGSKNLEMLRAAGGNSIRTWGADSAGGLLDRAQSLGLTVTVGIWLGHKEHGFKYDDPAMLAEQAETVRRHVARLKDHPALLFWALGNEMEGDGTDDNVWRHIEQLAAAVKKADPNHPVITVIAEIGTDKLARIARLCPSLDAVGINAYGGLPTLAERVRSTGWTKPYLVTEFGPRGPWEVTKTDWNAPLEATSTEKAAFYRDGYQRSIDGAKAQCVGSYVFLWDDKLEATPTWFGMFVPGTGEKLATVDTMAALWKGKVGRPVPELLRFESTLAGKRVAAGSPQSVTVALKSRIAVQIRYEIRREDGGFVDEFTDTRFAAPTRPGPYRLSVTVRDGFGGAATANVPFYVE
jgi:hypothetical protein